MASDWPANQLPGFKICVNKSGFKHGHFLVTQAAEVYRELPEAMETIGLSVPSGMQAKSFLANDLNQ